MDLKVKYAGIFGQAAKSSQFLKMESASLRVFVQSALRLPIPEARSGAVLIALGTEVLPDICGLVLYAAGRMQTHSSEHARRANATLAPFAVNRHLP